MDIIEPSLKFSGKLVKMSPGFSLYKSHFYPDIILTINEADNINILYAECNFMDIDSEILRKWFLELDGNLDNLLQKIDDEYGEQAPGFNENNNNNDDNEPVLSHINWNPERQLTIYTWGKRHHKNKPSQSQCNFNAAVINGHRDGMNLRKLTGLNIDVQKSVKSGIGYIKFMEFMINKIESGDLHTISLNCSAGRHRCVSCAEILKSEFYPNSIIHHLDISR